MSSPGRWLVALVALVAIACGGDERSPATAEPAECEEMECYRPYVCVERCDGPVIASGCCACAAGQLDRLVDCPDEATTEAPTEDREPAAAAAAPSCRSDADCRAITDCACACVPQHVSVPPPQGEAWSTMCDGSPPPNCGVQSPCATFEAACVDSRCVVRANDADDE